MALVVTVSGEDSNSYTTLAEGNTYFEGRLHCSDWTEASNPDKEKSLIQSARIFNQYVDWIGLKTDEDQALQWPRKNICYDGVSYFDCGTWLSLSCEYSWILDSTAIPQIIKDAQCELSLVLLPSDTQSSADLSSLSFAGLKMDIKKSSSLKIIPDHVWQIVSSLGSLRGGMGTVKLLRC